VRHVAPELLGKLTFVVCVNLGIVAPPRHGHIRQPAIHQFFASLLCVYVNEYAVGGLSLAAVARHSIAVVEMPILFDVECDGPA
jgi:hypothetical protein